MNKSLRKLLRLCANAVAVVLAVAGLALLMGPHAFNLPGRTWRWPRALLAPQTRSTKLKMRARCPDALGPAGEGCSLEVPKGAYRPRRAKVTDGSGCRDECARPALTGGSTGIDLELHRSAANPGRSAEFRRPHHRRPAGQLAGASHRGCGHPATPGRLFVGTPAAGSG